jgi:anti-sigma factor ChrR (cupin superfamily)
MRQDLKAADIQVPLLEIDPEMRQNFLASPQLEYATAMAIHVHLRMRRHIRFSRLGREASLDEVVEKIADVIWMAPDYIVKGFADDAAAAAAATTYLTKEILGVLTASFETTRVSEDYG